ncbi:hypothetical protein D3C76_1511880 [compost metagenome]
MVLIGSINASPRSVSTYSRCCLIISGSAKASRNCARWRLTPDWLVPRRRAAWLRLRSSRIVNSAVSCAMLKWLKALFIIALSRG